MVDDNLPNNLIVENTIDAIKATIYRRRRWGMFLPSLFVLLMSVLFFLSILGIILFSFAQKYLPGIAAAIVVFACLSLFLFLIYKRQQDALESIFDTEIVKIDGQTITIERSGVLFFRSKKVFLADKIKGLTTSFSVSERFQFLSRLPFTNSLGAFMVWNRRWIKPFYNFGNDISQNDAQNFIETVYSKYPQYRYSSTP